MCVYIYIYIYILSEYQPLLYISTARQRWFCIEYPLTFGAFTYRKSCSD